MMKRNSVLPTSSVRGFTLIETLVAITVLTLSIVGPFHAVQTALTTSYISRDQLTASSLAQEALEYVRSIRENNYLSGRTWTDGLSSYACYSANPTNYCIVDPTQGDVHSSPDAMAEYANTSAVPFLYVSAANLYNQQNSGTVSRFKRYLQVEEVSSTEIRVTVTVSWTTALIPFTVTITDVLRNWL